MTEPTPEPRPFVAYPPIESFPRYRAAEREALAVDAGLIAKALRSVGRLMQFPRLWRGRP